MKFRKRLIPIGVVITSIIVLFIAFSGPSTEDEVEMITDVKKGPFLVDITTTGELEAKNSVKILGPSGLRNYRIWNVSIQNIIDEGTYVKKGQFVASLDKSELTNKLNEAQIELEKIESQYTQTKLDTSLQMREARDELINLEYTTREKQLVLDQSQFEPPATIQKAEIELEKAKRAHKQAIENYDIKKQQNVAKMVEVTASLRKQRLTVNGMQELSDQFTIVAPEDGMLIYHKDWDGKPIKAGSQIGAWNPVVATLPDLSVMVSQTYVNEVDIRKVKVGQEVELGLDAFPDRKLSGKVVRVANVGEQRPNSDAKVFKVEIELNERDDLLRPAMTTSNRIVTKSYEEVIFIPLECLHNHADSITYVFKKEGLNTTKQEVMIGDANENEVIILAGLGEEDKVYLSNLSSMANDKITLIPEMEGKRNISQEEIAQEEASLEKPARRRRR